MCPSGRIPREMTTWFAVLGPPAGSARQVSAVKETCLSVIDWSSEGRYTHCATFHTAPLLPINTLLLKAESTDQQHHSHWGPGWYKHRAVVSPSPSRSAEGDPGLAGPWSRVQPEG